MGNDVCVGWSARLSAHFVLLLWKHKVAVFCLINRDSFMDHHNQPNALYGPNWAKYGTKGIMVGTMTENFLGSTHVNSAVL